MPATRHHHVSPLRAVKVAFLMLSFISLGATLTLASPKPGSDVVILSKRGLDDRRGDEQQQQRRQQQQYSASRPRCKVIPGDASWPSQDAWRQLNESTGGRLLRPTPPGAVCHPGQATYDPVRCEHAQSAWTGHEFHAADPVSSMGNNWNNDSCLPEPSYPCSGQGYPVFVVNATEVEHVKLAVKFAKKHNVRLIVKATGHDYIGRSVAPNSLSIWTHHMKGIEYHESFTPKYCKGVKIEGGAVTARAGTQMGEAYAFTDAYNRTVVGGGGLTVGLGGFLTGAGHGLLAPKYGLAVDQVLEMEIVTPAGEVKVLNECKNQDLFWAMRGGGGSTFGIMTSVTLKTVPTPRISTLLFVAATDATLPYAEATFDLAAYIVSQYPKLSEAGMAGYSFIFNGIPNPIPDAFPGAPQGPVSGMFGILSLIDPADDQAAMDLWEPLQAHITAAFPGFLASASVTHYGAFWEWFQFHRDTLAVGGDSIIGSRLLGVEALTANSTATAEAFRQFSTVGLSTAYLVSGKGVWDAKPRGGGNAVLPAWRNALVHATNGIPFPPLNETAKLEAIELMKYTVDGLRKLAPDSGAYMNEANPFVPEWQKEFWGANYPRLHSIKRSVDPDDVLWCYPCVGGEGWKEVDGRLCRV